MNPLRNRCAAIIAVVLCGTTLAQEQKEGNWLVDRAITITPRAEPSPAFAYRLFPTTTQRVEGNAVPIYLRLNFEQSDANRREWRETPTKWNALAIDKIPLAEAKEFMNKYRLFYQQFELGARRKSAEWNYTLDQPSIIDVLLPDVQSMRGFMPMLVLKVRTELAQGNFAAAAHWLEVGFVFSQHVGNGPFLINRLVGIAGGSMFADSVLEFIEQPEAPNLYWSLTALPRPLIDLRDSLELEQAVMEIQFPEFADLDRPRSPEQWDAVLKKVRKEFQRLVQSDRESDNRFKPIPGTGPDDPAAKSPDLSAARKFVAERRKLAADKVEALPPAQVLLLYIIDMYHIYRDDCFKAGYLAYPQAKKTFAEAEERRKAALDTEARRFPDALLPAIQKVIGAQTRLERKIAAMRVIEALRLHAAANGGSLPDKLSDVKIAPIPNDPATNMPFEYKRDGNTATLVGLIPDEKQEIAGLRYRVTLKK
jgi:hypothetical protein